MICPHTGKLFGHLPFERRPQVLERGRQDNLELMQEYGDVTIYVDGYTDAIGSVPYNQRLSERRANAVKEYLQRHGVSATRMTGRGFGKSNPVATNDTAEGRAQNRRVELIVNNQ